MLSNENLYMGYNKDHISGKEKYQTNNITTYFPQYNQMYINTHTYNLLWM